MSTWNIYTRLLALLPETPVDVGTVTETTGDGGSVLLLTGDIVSVKGYVEAGDHVYLSGGVVIGPAPVLSTVEIEI